VPAVPPPPVPPAPPSSWCSRPHGNGPGDGHGQLARYLVEHREVALADVASPSTRPQGLQARDGRRRGRRGGRGPCSRPATRSRVLSCLAEAADRPVVFLFAGGGAQYPQHGARLYRTEPVFCEQVDLCLRLFAPARRRRTCGAIFPRAGRWRRRRGRSSGRRCAAGPLRGRVTRRPSSGFVGRPPAGDDRPQPGQYVAACSPG